MFSPTCAMLALIFISLLFPLVAAQSSGTFTINATDSTSGSQSGCFILAQIASLSKPNVITQMVPICPSSAGTHATTPASGMSVSWPMSSGGDGSSSSMAIYGQSAGTSAGCVMSLSQMQAMYLLGRALKWDNQQNELWDETAAGYVSDPKSFAVVTCGADASLLPAGLELPDPYNHNSGDGIWTKAITLTASTEASPTGDTPSTPTTTVTKHHTSTVIKTSDASSAASPSSNATKKGVEAEASVDADASAPSAASSTVTFEKNETVAKTGVVAKVTGGGVNGTVSLTEIPSLTADADSSAKDDSTPTVTVATSTTTTHTDTVATHTDTVATHTDTVATHTDTVATHTDTVATLTGVLTGTIGNATSPSSPIPDGTPSPTQNGDSPLKDTSTPTITVATGTTTTSTHTFATLDGAQTGTVGNATSPLSPAHNGNPQPTDDAKSQDKDTAAPTFTVASGTTTSADIVATLTGAGVNATSPLIPTHNTDSPLNDPTFTIAKHTTTSSTNIVATFTGAATNTKSPLNPTHNENPQPTGDKDTLLGDPTFTVAKDTTTSTDIVATLTGATVNATSPLKPTQNGNTSPTGDADTLLGDPTFRVATSTTTTHTDVAVIITGAVTKATSPFIPTSPKSDGTPPTKGDAYSPDEDPSPSPTDKATAFAALLTDNDGAASPSSRGTPSRNSAYVAIATNSSEGLPYYRNPSPAIRPTKSTVLLFPTSTAVSTKVVATRTLAPTTTTVPTTTIAATTTTVPTSTFVATNTTVATSTVIPTTTSSIDLLGMMGSDGSMTTYAQFSGVATGIYKHKAADRRDVNGGIHHGAERRRGKWRL